MNEYATRNLSTVSGHFICGKCWIHVEDYVRVIYDEDSKDTTYQYKFKYCPECGRKVVEEW